MECGGIGVAMFGCVAVGGWAMAFDSFKHEDSLKTKNDATIDEDLNKPGK